MMDIDRSMRSTLAAAEARHEEMWEWIADNFPREPFWYLDHLAVDSEHRGTGLGAALIRHGLDFADRDGVPGVPRDGPAGERRVLRAARLPDDRGRRRARRRPAPLVHALRPLSAIRARHPIDLGRGSGTAGLRYPFPDLQEYRRLLSAGRSS